MNATSKQRADELWLHQSDVDDFLHVVADLKKHAKYDVVIGGSVAQRLLLPSLGRQLARKRLYDVDVAITGGSLSESPLEATVVNDFFVMHLVESKDSYAFGLLHKKTFLWIDVFSEPYHPRRYLKRHVAGQEYLVAPVEGQILWMARDIISRITKNEGIHRKHIARLEWLMKQSEIDQVLLNNEYQEHRAYYAKKGPADEIAKLHTAQEFVAYAIAAGKRFPKNHTIWDRIAYPREIVTTPNGIHIESRCIHTMLYPWYVWQFCKKIFGVY